MTTSIIVHRVADYDAWRAVYDAFGDEQDAGGVEHRAVWRSQDDPNLVIVHHDFADRATADAFLGGDKLKDAMGRAGVDESSLQIYLTDPA
jgi:hypothetical protein